MVDKIVTPKDDLVERIEKAIERVEQVRLHQPGGHLGLSNDTYTLLSSVLADCLTALHDALKRKGGEIEELEQDQERLEKLVIAVMKL